MATYTTLRNGSSGADVKKLQQTLKSAGYDIGSAGVDGIYGNQTAAAVKAYQKANGLSVDGIAGNQTLGSLYGAKSPTASTAPKAPTKASSAQTSAPILDPAKVTNGKKAEDYGSFEYNPFEYEDYKEGDAVAQWRDKFDSLQKPGDYKSNYEDTIKAITDKILNREKFSYDLNGDALYQQYKDQYILQGQMAMQDTIGQAAAMTGGYGNSYAQNVGQQAYQGYLQQLNDKVPELYQLALDQYNREGEEMYNQYGLLADREATEYGRHRDSVSDYQADRGFYADQLNAERQFDYSKYSDQRNFDYGVYADDRNLAYNEFSDDRNLEYQLDRNAVADYQWKADYEEAVKNNNRNYELAVEEIEEAKRHNKISEEQAQQQIDNAKAAQDEANKIAWAEYELKKSSAGSSGGGSGGSGGSGGGSGKQLTADEWKTVEDNCSMYGDNYNGLKNYINGLVNRGYISADEGADLWETYGNSVKPYSPYSAGSIFNKLTVKEKRLGEL